MDKTANCRFIYAGVHSYGNQERGEVFFKFKLTQLQFGTGSFIANANIINRTESNNVVAGVGRVLITDTGKAYVYNTTSHYFELIQTDFTVKKAVFSFAQQTVYLLATNGSAYVFSNKTLSRFPIPLTIEDVSGPFFVTASGDFYAADINQPMNYTKTISIPLDGVGIAAIEASKDIYKSEHYAVILKNGTALLWGLNTCML